MRFKLVSDVGYAELLSKVKEARSMWYLTVSATVFIYWFSLFIADKTTPKSDFASWIIILIAPLFWPIVLPISALELMTKSALKERSTTNDLQQEEMYYHNEQLG